MKKFTFHIDMIIVVAFLFILCIVGNIYQNKLHGDLHKDYIALIKQSRNTEMELISAKSALEIYENNSADY